VAHPATASDVATTVAACISGRASALRHPVLAQSRSALRADGAPADALGGRLAVPARALGIRERSARARYRPDPGQRLPLADAAAAALVPTADVAATGVLVARQELLPWLLSWSR
jgi:hypothetical protein